jgi:hypothetical protein
MRRFRFSIASLLVLILVTGLGLAALRSPSWLWAGVMINLDLAVLTIAVLGAIYRRGTKRAYWLGLALGGWIYFSLGFCPWLTTELGPQLLTTALLDILYPRVTLSEERVQPVLPYLPRGPQPGDVGPLPLQPAAPPSAAMMPAPTPAAPPQNFLNPSSAWSPDVPPRDPWSAWTEPDRSSGVGMAVGNVVLVSPEAFRKIGHALFTLLIALIAAEAARSFASARLATRTRPARAQRSSAP